MQGSLNGTDFDGVQIPCKSVRDFEGFPFEESAFRLVAFMN